MHTLFESHVNLLVTLSNIVGIIGLWYCSGLKQFILGFSVITSILMHLSERHYGLPGVYPFNQYSYFFLWCDRIAAYIAGLYALYYIHNTTYALGIMTLCAIISGFVAFVSLLKSRLGYYTITHGIWHILVYSIFLKLTE